MGKMVFFNVFEDGRLDWTRQEENVLQGASPKRIRVVAQIDGQWHVDPCSENINSMWVIWVFGKCPLVRLQWDLDD